MEPITLYIPRRAPISAEELKQFAGDAEIQIEGEGEQWTRATVKFKDATLHLIFKPNEAPEDFREHLAGFQGYVWKCAGREMTSPVYALIQRLYLVSSNVGTRSEPGVTPDVESYLSSLAGNVHGLIFRNASVCGPDFSPLITPDGYVEGATMSYWPDSEERRKKNIALLEKQGIETPPILPIASEQEVTLREASQVAVRAAVLYFLASYAVPKGIDRATAREKLTPFAKWITEEEQAFLDAENPERQLQINFTWRFEALWVLLWALGVVDDLGSPEKPQAVSTIDAKIEGHGGIQAMLEGPKLRPASEILDQADFTMRAQWAVREARRMETAPPAGLNGSVLQERHHALNWLIQYKWSDWDDVDTPT